MRVYSAAAMCDVIDVTLFKFNHYDNLIWTKALNQLDYLQADDNSIIIIGRRYYWYCHDCH